MSRFTIISAYTHESHGSILDTGAEQVHPDADFDEHVIYDTLAGEVVIGFMEHENYALMKLVLARINDQLADEVSA